MPNSPILVFDADGRCVAAFGNSGDVPPSWPAPDTLTGRTLDDSLLGSYAAQFAELVSKTLEHGLPSRHQVDAALPHGRLSFEAEVWKVAGAPLVAFQIRNLSAGLRERLAASESRLEAVVAQSVQFACEIDEDGVLTYVAAQARELGLMPDKLVGSRIVEIGAEISGLSPSELAEARASLERFIRDRSALQPYTFSLEGTNGKKRSFSATGDWYRTASGEQRGILVLNEVREAGEAGSRRAAMQSLADHLVDAVLELNLNGEILSATPVPETWVGSGERLVGRTVFDFIHAEDAARARLALASAAPGIGLEPLMFRWRGARGGWRSLATRSVTYVQEDGTTRIIAVGRDVTDEIALSREPKSAESPEPANSISAANLAVLAGGVAHDFNNLLTISLGVTDLIGEQLSSESPIRGYLSELATASRTAAKLARQLLSLTGRDTPSNAPVDLVSELHEISGLLRSSLSRRIAFSFETHEESLWIEGDSASLRRLILNLIVNAGEAIGEGPGRVVVRAARAPGGPNGLAVVAVEDDGPGLSPELRQHVFDAGFTTKENGHGLGLTVARAVVERHDGQLHVESPPAGGRGTVFRFEIPLLAGRAVEDKLRLELLLEQSSDPRGRVVLLVDDDPAVRRVSAAMLGLAGIEVLEADTAQAARDLFAATPHIDCAVIDIVMPDDSGLRLVEEFRAARADLKLVVCSGAHDRMPFDRKDVTLLEKPFRYAQLIEAVSAAAKASG